jgi:amino-acid N-acetyltransferase
MVATRKNCGSIAFAELISRIQMASPSKRNRMRTREALLPDAERIHELISAYSSDGTLLPRTLAEICESIRDFVVLEKHGKIIGCGALHLFGPHLAEIRSITVAKSHQKHGGGEQLVQSLMSRARKRQVSCICLFTRSPQFFAKLGFETAQRSDLPEKINKDCCVCPRYHCCDEVAMVKGELSRFAIVPESRNALVKLQVRAQLGSGGQ